MIAAWGFLEWFFTALIVGLVGIASLVGLYVLVTLTRNSGFDRTPSGR